MARPPCAGPERSRLTANSKNVLVRGGLAGVTLGLPFTADGLEPLAWVAAVPFLVLLSSEGVGRGFAATASAGFAFVATGLFWLGRLSPAAVAIGAALFGGYLVALALVPWVRRRAPALPLWGYVPLLWAFAESLPASVTPYRTTWLSIGYTQAFAPRLCQIAEWTGVGGVTVMVMLANAAGADAIAAWRRRGAPTGARPSLRACALGLGLALALPCAALVVGTWRLEQLRASLRSGPRVRLVQGNRGPTEDSATTPRYFHDLVRLSTSFGAPVDLVAWPETAPVRPEDPAHAAAVRRMRAEVGAPLLLGAFGISREPGERRRSNSAFLIGADGSPVARYDKQVLVPFGEYVPFVDGIPALRRVVEDYVAQAYGFLPFLRAGNESTLFPLEWAGRTLRFGVLICYEDVLPELAAGFASQGADFLLVISNENFYYAREMDQHVDMAVFRAIETRRPVLRATNTGLTVAIDPTGAVTALLERDRQGALDVDVKLLASPPPPRSTVPYFGLVCGVALACVFAAALRRAPV